MGETLKSFSIEEIVAQLKAEWPDAEVSGPDSLNSLYIAFGHNLRTRVELAQHPWDLRFYCRAAHRGHGVDVSESFETPVEAVKAGLRALPQSYRAIADDIEQKIESFIASGASYKPN